MILIGGVVPRAMGSAHPNIAPYQAFAAADGWVVLAGANDRLFQRLCAVLGMEHLAGDTRFVDNASRVAHRSQLTALIAPVVRRRAVAHWVEECRRAAVPAAPVRHLGELFAAPESAALVEEIADPLRSGELRLVRSPMLGLPGPESRPPPTLGEHTAAVRERLWD